MEVSSVQRGKQQRKHVTWIVLLFVVAVATGIAVMGLEQDTEDKRTFGASGSWGWG